MKYEITAELNLRKIIEESREVAEALNDFADNLERIEKKYEEPQADEGAGEWNIEEPIERYHSRNIRAYAEDMGISVEQAEKELLKEVENENEEICNG